MNGSGVLLHVATLTALPTPAPPYPHPPPTPVLLPSAPPPLFPPARPALRPAVAAYVGCASLARARGVSGRPEGGAVLAAGYAGVTLAGMALLGRAEWASRCEGLTVRFSLVGRFGPVEVARDARG